MYQIIKELQQMEEKELPKPKKSFCRFYLRGLCIYSSKQCPFAHGVWDLNYQQWKQGQEIQYDYHKTRDKNQPSSKAKPIYKDLYQYQTEKIFTLQQLNEDRKARNLVRYQMYRQRHDDFMQLLQSKYPDTIFTEEFLLREFTRVGFNKFFNGPMKFNQILTEICEGPNSRYFKSIKVIPPNPNKQNILARRASKEEIIQTYKEVYQKIIQGQTQIEEGALKKKFFTIQLPENVPPINIILKELKLGLKEFLQQQLKVKQFNIIFQCSIENIQAEANNFLSAQLPKRMLEWGDVFQHISKTLKNNNGNLINQVRPHLVLDGNAFLFFPMLQLIYNPKINPFFQSLSSTPCKCNYQKPYPLQELLITKTEDVEPLKEGQSFDIFSFQTLRKCAPHILSSSVLGVDLQGRLRKGGFVEMVQLNNGRNTFLFDIWQMNELGDFQTFWLARKVLRNVMVDSNIVKIFHDCRHDSIGLHQMLQTCVINVFDTSATQTLINQLNTYEDIWNKQHKDPLNACKQAISQCNNVKTPGLNEIFKKYQASHGINKNKDKYHKMWSKGDLSFFCKRPIDPDYRDYCIRDVLDLPQVYEKMLSSLSNKTAQNLAYWISNQYAKQGFNALEQQEQPKNK